ncbi:MAG: AAA family ATPase, partial [Methanosarcinaceae archaeon]|nr:AAA family ATPase [Methanosarcinaceae archaeon]
MKIAQINIEKLFGLYDHEIKLNLNERITIIHGQNGVGKTIILQMLNSVFNDRYDIFYEIPFEEFSVKFDSGDVLSLKKRYNEQDNQKELNLSLNDDKQSQIQFSSISDEQTCKKILQQNKNLRRVGPGEWLDILDGEVLDTKDLLDR